MGKNKIKLNLLSLAPDTFVLGSANIIEQFSPKKVVNIVNESHKASCNCTDCSLFNKLWGVEIHLTSACPLDCVRCSYAQRNKCSLELSIETVKKILNSIEQSNVKSVIFSGGGEPLSWEGGGFEDCIRENINYKQSITTNGIGLINKLSKKLLQRLDIIQINVNGYDKQSYAQNTQTDMFDLFVANINWLFKNRDKNATQVTGKAVMDKNNYKEVGQYLQFCAQMGFDVVVIKVAGNFEPGQDVALNSSQKQELRELINNSPFVAQYSHQLDAIATEDNVIEFDMPGKCWVVEHGLYMLIRSNGDVFPCVVSPNSSANKIGNVNEANIDEIWGSTEHIRIQEKLHDDMLSCKCDLGICRHMRYNFLLDDELRSTEYIKLLPEITKDPELL